MAQRVDYRVFPGAQKDELIRLTYRLLEQVESGELTFKSFRESLREKGIWDKETSPQVFDLLGIQLKPELALTPLGKRLVAAKEEADRREVLFSHFREQNLLLTKMSLEALDTEAGGRLHSTHELHRMLTSYVYPGDKINLVDFQAWIVWLEACGAVRNVGIRWGLGDLARENMGWFRTRDVDEILEDEEEESQASPPESAAPVEAETPSVVSLPVEPSVKGTEAETEVTESPPASAPAPVSREDKVLARQPPPALAAEPGGPEVMRWLNGDWAAWTGPRDLHAMTLGIGSGLATENPGRWIASMVTLGIWAEQGISQDWVTAAFSRLDEDNVFEILGKGGGLEAALAPHHFYASEPGVVKLLGALSFGVRAVWAWKSDPDGWKSLLEEGDSLRRYNRVHELLFGGAHPVASFWLVREAQVLGLWAEGKG